MKTKTTSKKTSMAKVLIAFLVVVLSLTLQACLAAAIPMLIGSGMFQTYKAIQLTSGDGEVQIGFLKEEYTSEEREQLSKINKLAIFPTSINDLDLEVALAERLSLSEKIEIITPSKVLTALSRIQDSSGLMFNSYTSAEKMKLMSDLCEELGADGVFYITAKGSEINTNTWSFSRPDITQEGELSIYSKSFNSVVLSDTVAVKTTIAGANMAASIEINQIAGRTIAERILEQYK